MARLIFRDAERRAAIDPAVWPLAEDATKRIESSINSALTDPNPPFRQAWLLARDGDRIVGVAHTILLPVPPIYAGTFGPPGLIMEDCCLADAAPDGAGKALIQAAEADLVAAGAQVLLASSASGGAWHEAMADRGFEPLTLYLAKSGLSGSTAFTVRSATPDDMPAFVAASARNREILHRLNGYWKPHAEADARFEAWMRRSLTFADRDMLVSAPKGELKGYGVFQPATALHFPPAHDIGGAAVIDDYYHADFADPQRLAQDGAGALDLLHAGEAALAARGRDVALVVCPADWASKLQMLTSDGYATAITWFIKQSG